MEQGEVSALGSETEGDESKAAAEDTEATAKAAAEESPAARIESGASGKNGASSIGGASSALSSAPGTLATGAEVSAATIGRMMGLATMSDLKLIDGKLDLLATRVNNLTVRMDKVLNTVTNAPTGADLDRIDVTIGALRTLVKDALVKAFGDPSEGKEKGVSGAKIMTSKPAASAESPNEAEAEKTDSDAS